MQQESFESIKEEHLKVRDNIRRLLNQLVSI